MYLQNKHFYFPIFELTLSIPEDISCKFLVLKISLCLLEQKLVITKRIIKQLHNILGNKERTEWDVLQRVVMSQDNVKNKTKPH